MKHNFTEYKWTVCQLNLKTNERKYFVFNDAGYREIVSKNSFFHGLHDYHKGFDYTIKITHVFSSGHRYRGLVEESPRIWEYEWLQKLEAGDYVVCSCLYDFYDKIGFDRKNKKMLTNINN